MAIGSSLSGITFGGLGSGIDTDSIVSRLMQLEALPLQRMVARQNEIKSLQGVYGQLRSRLVSLNTAAGSLNNPSAFNPVTAATTKAEVATISGGSATTAGTYNLAVSKLAQAQKIASSPQTDTTTPLNQSGTVVVNGRAVVVEVSDSLQTVAQKINSANAGVTASLLNAGTGVAYLTLTSNDTGLAKKVQISDLSGTVAQTLGLVTGAAAIREPITSGAASGSFSSKSTALGTLLGLSAPGNTSFEINGTTVNVNLATDGLQAVADAVNASGSGATATVKSVTENGTTSYKLEIVGASAPTFVDTNGFLQAMGVLRRSYGSELLAAQDAEFEIDGIAFTNGSNTISTAIPGATITLLKANETTPETTTLTLKRDVSGVKKKIQEFVDAYNSTVEFIKQNSSFDTETFTSGPLFGDATSQQVEAAVSDMLFNRVPGLTGTYTDLSSLGFRFEQNGKLTFDDAALTQAMNSAPDAVEALFRARGTGSTADLIYISSTNATQTSGTGAFNVEITQVATKGYSIGELAQSSPSTGAERLTFNGALFAGTAYTLDLPVGSTLADTISRINSDSKLRELVVASDDGGRLRIDSKRYGTSGNFTVVSNTTAGTDNSGLGVGSLGTQVSGVDVAGKINGENATGAGQFLTGDSASSTVGGLQIQYTGSATGLVGTMKYTKGMAAQLTSTIGTLTDTVNGLLTGTDQALKARLDQLTLDIEDFEKRITLKEQDLRARFARMEQAIAQIQSQSARLGALNPSG